MNWKIVFQKFITTAITGAMASIATVLQTPSGVEGIDPKHTALVAIVVGFGGALWNWWKHKDLSSEGN